MDCSSSSSSSSDESTTTNDMGRAHSLGRPPPKRELDLSALMNVEQKNQLQQLLNDAMDDMQKRVRLIFDDMEAVGEGSNDMINPPKALWQLVPNPRSAKYAHLFGNEPLSKPKDPESESQKENNKAVIEPTPIPAILTAAAAKGILEIPKSMQEASDMIKPKENDCITSSLNELKRDALTNFGKWRGAVLKRIGDITIKNGGNPGNAIVQAPQPPGTGRRPIGAGRGRPMRLSGVTSGGPVASVQESNRRLKEVYRDIPSPLSTLPKEKRALILHCILLMLLGLENYNTYSRILLHHLASSMHIPLHVLADDEIRVARGLSRIVDGISLEEIAQKRAEESKSNRRNKSGASSAATTLSTYSGVLPAHLAAQGIGTVFGGFGLGSYAIAGLLGTMAESTVVVGTLFGLYGARATGKMVDSYVKDVQDFALIPLHGSLHKEFTDPKDLHFEDRRLRLTVTIAGWLNHEDDITRPGWALGDKTELYALRWELEALNKMGQALETVIKSTAWTDAKKEIPHRSVFESFRSAVWPIGLLKASKVVDNPWNVGMVRAEKAGLVLADAIINKVTGERGITLIGYSLGARVIYACLMQLHEKRHFGCVENVIFMGAPCPCDTRTWASMKSVVAGRMVNVYSKNDFLLGFLYRSSTWQYGVAGLQAIHAVHGVESIDVSDTVTNHFRYKYLVSSILKYLSWEDIDYSQVARDQVALQLFDEDEKNLEKERAEQERMHTPAKVGMNKAGIDKKNTVPTKSKKKRAGAAAKRSG